RRAPRPPALAAAVARHKSDDVVVRDQLSGLYHSGEGPAIASISGTSVRSSSATSAPRFSTIFCQFSASPIGYCAGTTAPAAGGSEMVALNPRPQTRYIASTLWPRVPTSR